jgi:putative AbiEii toxin of type IV toxin-antitoxin system
MASQTPTIVLENVRSFIGRHEIGIAPLTILVGENNAGKTTFMASVSVISASATFPLHPRFDAEPYRLGGFETIASYDTVHHRHSPTFSLGFVRNDGANKAIAEATYTNLDGEPALSSFHVENQAGRLRVVPSGSQFSLTLKVPGRRSLNLKSPRRPGELMESGGLLGAVLDASFAKGPRWNQEALAHFLEISALGQLGASAVFSIAPVRSRPRRTYNQFASVFDPEGGHIPRVLDEQLRSKDTRGFEHALNAFGSSSGLFDKIRIEKLGSRKSAAPLRVLVKLGGVEVNLSDVGYGVSQCLPILAQCLLAPERGHVMLQQPEVHLHPRAQAAMGSFFVNLVADGSRRLFVETHSDFILDRVRQEVAKGSISQDRVAIIFFERKGEKTEATRINLDQAGNIIEPPDSYRSFFLEEQVRTLTRGR